MREIPPYYDCRADDGGVARVWLDGKIEIINDTPSVAGFKAATEYQAPRAEVGATVVAALKEVVEAHTKNNPGPIKCTCGQCRSMQIARDALSQYMNNGEGAK